MVDFGLIAIISGLFLMCGACSVAGSFLYQMVFGSSLIRKIDKRLENVEIDIDEFFHSQDMKQRSVKGVEAKQEKAARKQMALAEAAIMLKEGKNYADILKELAPKYPDVAAGMIKSGGLF